MGLLNSINDCLTEKQHGFSDIYSISEDLDEVFFCCGLHFIYFNTLLFI